MARLKKGQFIEFLEEVSLHVKDAPSTCSEDFSKGEVLLFVKRYLDTTEQMVCVFVSPKTLNFIEWRQYSFNNYMNRGEKFKLL